MTPSYRRRLYREFAIALLLAAMCIYGVVRGHNSLLVAFIVMATIAYFVLLAKQIAISRCPRCRAMVDLRDPGKHCSNCGVWLPSKAELEQNESAVQQDTYVEFTSHLDNSFVAPSHWTSTDKGNTFSLQSHDGHAF